jgi:hypothetical protein
MMAWVHPGPIGKLCAEHLFVGAIVAGVHPGLPPIGKSEDRGQFAFGAVKFSGATAKCRRSAGVAPPFIWQIEVLPPAGLVALRQTLFVAAMMAWVHPGLRRKSANQDMTGCPPFIGKSLLSGPDPRAGLVALRQTFVRRCHGGWGSFGKSEHEPEGQSAFKA